MSTDNPLDHSFEDHGGNAKFFVIFLALCFLTAMSFFTYSSYWPQALDSDSIKRTFMMAVSCTKAMLVILFFMHLLWEANWKYALTIPASLMSLFLVLMLIPDVGMRLNNASRERRLHMAAEQTEQEPANHHEQANPREKADSEEETEEDQPQEH